MEKPLTFFERYGVILKALLIFVICFILMLPASLVSDLIRERQSRKQEAITEVSSKWGERQVLTGPYISVPYKEIINSADNKITYVKKYAHFLPEKLNIGGNIDTDVRRRSIYDVIVYSGKIQLSGSFNPVKAEDVNISPDNFYWDEAVVNLGITDMRGIQETISLTSGNESSVFNPGTSNKDISATGVSATVLKEKLLSGFPFSINLSLRGSEQIFFSPLGKETEVTLASAWKDPKFDGAFLPAERTIDDKGFKAKWKVLNLNRSFPQYWTESRYQIDAANFGVSLIQSVDSYTKSDRSVKYALMTIGLTFLTFFFIEILNRKPVHPFQYILVGLAQIIFYSLVISMSEHLSFNASYIIAGGATVILIALYTKAIIHSARLAATMLGMLVLLYGFLFIVLQMEDYALLIGSISLFIIIAIVMYISRKVDWYNISGDEPKRITAAKETPPEEPVVN